MTRRDFVALAEALRAAQPVPHRANPAAAPAWDAWVACVARVADALDASNPRFDRNRFLVACGAWSLAG